MFFYIENSAKRVLTMIAIAPYPQAWSQDVVFVARHSEFRAIVIAVCWSARKSPFFRRAVWDTKFLATILVRCGHYEWFTPIECRFLVPTRRALFSLDLLFLWVPKSKVRPGTGKRFVYLEVIVTHTWVTCKPGKRGIGPNAALLTRKFY